MIEMRAALGLGNDFVDDSQFLQIARGNFQRFGGDFGFGRIAPKNRSATLRRNHGVDGILQHVHAIADGNRQRAARTAFSRDGHNDGHGQARHLAKIARDGFGLAALFGIDSRIGAGRIDKRKNGPAEFCGQLHHAQRLAIAFRLRLAEIQRHALFGVSALLLADQHHRASVISREAGDHRGIVAIGAVAMQFMKIFEQDAHIIHHVGTLRMARQ